MNVPTPSRSEDEMQPSSTSEASYKNDQSDEADRTAKDDFLAEKRGFLVLLRCLCGKPHLDEGEKAGDSHHRTDVGGKIGDTHGGLPFGIHLSVKVQARTRH